MYTVEPCSDCGLSRKVALIWTSRWSPTKVLYFANKYSPLFDTVLGVIGKFLDSEISFVQTS